MSRTGKIRSLFDRFELDAILLRDPKNRFYATGFSSSAGTVLITKGGSWLFTDSRYIEAARNAVTDAEVVETSLKNKESELISGVLRDAGVRRLGAEEDFLSYSAFTGLETALGRKLTPAQKLVSELRKSKEPAELEALRAAQEITERALDDTLAMIAPGVTEREIAAELVFRQLKYGAEAMSFEPIVVAGKKSSLPHGEPGENAIESGDFVTLDFGCVYGGYCSDMTRTIAVGSASDEMKRVYDLVLSAQLAGIEAARAGIKGAEIDKAAREVIAGAGYGEYFGHGFGHGIGLEVHEAPGAGPSANDILPEGAVISAEPGVYLPGKFGVRIEDVLILSGDGCENITKAPKRLIVL